MLDQVDLSVSLDKATFRKEAPRLRDRLHELQLMARNAGVATILVLEGWDASGKGSLISHLVEGLDPRGFRVCPTYGPLIDELYRPWLWRFWMRLPGYGGIAVFDRSWYGRVLVERIEGITNADDVEAAFREINDFERTLADDGQVIVKLLLHISKKEQRRRFKKAEKDPYQRWKIKPEDWRHHRQYDEYREAMEEMLERTGTEFAPWTIVESHDRRWADVKAFSALVAALEERLNLPNKAASTPSASPARVNRRNRGSPDRAQRR